jgi:hypothetical protein
MLISDNRDVNWKEPVSWILFLCLVIMNSVELFELMSLSTCCLACPGICFQCTVVTLCAVLHVMLDLHFPYVLNSYIFCMHKVLLFA